MKSKRFRLFVMLGFGFVLQSNGQTCRELLKEANQLLQEGKLGKAKTKYQQVVNCGDNFYVPDSKRKIEWIDRITSKPNKAKPFSISDSEITIPYQGGQDVVTIDGDGTWTASIDEKGMNWCKIKKERSKIVIVSEANEVNVERVCEISISMKGDTKKVIVRNEGAPEILMPSVENITFPYKGETNTVAIRSNTNWEIKDVPSWVITNKEDDGKIMLTALENEYNQERQADIKIESTNKSVIINVYQSAGLDHLAFSKNHLHFGADGGDEYINVYTDAEDWRLGDFPHWCQVTRVADNMLRVHCTPNEPINLIREASVNVTTGKQHLGINVSQEAKPFVAVVPNIGIGGRTISVGVQAGYIMPMLSTSAGGNFKGSVVNYALGNNIEEASYSTQGGFTVGVFADLRLYKNFYLKAGVEYLQYKYNNEFLGDVEYVQALQTSKYQKGVTQNKYTENYSMSFIDIPILASYRIPVTKISHVQIHMGPVISYGLSAKLKLSGNTSANDIRNYKIINNQMTNQRADMYIGRWERMGHGEMDLYSKSVEYVETYSDAVLSNGDIPKNSTFDASPLKRLNIGARIGLAYEYAGISLGVEYNLMLSNMANKKYWEGERWKIFDRGADVLMSGYKQRNHYLTVKLGYTFRY